ncbi:unnamed protein product [Linum tenue]|uniref:Uncharacterized protein n=1 Tax=Linum tenue TaxID=586396 RepID=A0AAV0MKM8_9ROSI|nr:unnamed protein product [Linum tenue]
MGCEFEFSARFGSVGPGHTGSMSSADELFLNGQIRPQVLAPLLDLDEGEEEGEEAELGGNKKGFHGESRGRDAENQIYVAAPILVVRVRRRRRRRRG